MSTGLDLTDEFVFQFQKLHDQCETLRRRIDDRPVVTIDHLPPVTPDPKLVEQVRDLTREVSRLQQELVARQQSLDKALASESEARKRAQEAVDANSNFKQDVDRSTKAQHQIANLTVKIQQLEQLLSEKADRRPDHVGMSFDQAFPEEAKELRKLSETVFLYRKKYGPII